MTEGKGNLKVAKHFNNAIGEILFDIPLANVRFLSYTYILIFKIAINHKVCIPALHLSLGIFNRIWNLLEDNCQELDFKCSLEVSGNASVSDCEHLRKLSSLKAEIEVETKYSSVLSEMITYTMLSSDLSTTSELLESLEAKLDETNLNIQTKVNMRMINTHIIH